MEAARTERLPERPLVESAAMLAHGYLQQADRAVRQVGRPGRPEALHDFRVALRRCRSVLRAYRPWLGKAAGKRIRRSLRSLMRQTNRSRDAEVQILWLEGVRPALRRGERAGLNYLLARLRRRRRAGQAAAAALRGRFEQLDAALRARLERTAPAGLTFGGALGERLQEYAAGVSERLAAASGPEDGEALHDFRLAVKRLRYLVEPAAGGLAGGEAAAKALKGVQDVLGEINDAGVLAAAVDGALARVSAEQTARLRRLALAGADEELARARRRDERLGLVRILRLLHDRRQELLRRLRSDHLDAARSACASLERAGAALAGGAGAPAGPAPQPAPSIPRRGA